MRGAAPGRRDGPFRMNTPMERRTFIQRTLGCAATCLAAASLPSSLAAETVAPPADTARAVAIHDWLTQFVTSEEKSLDRAALVKLLEQRGRFCCARLDFRQKLIADSHGDVDELVRLMGKIVGAENCRREGDTVTLVYPTDQCGCGWSPKRAPSPDDPYCDCSKANNQRLFEIVSGRPVRVAVTDSPRRTGKPCRFVIQLG